MDEQDELIRRAVEAYYCGDPFPVIERRRYRRAGWRIVEPDLMPCLLPCLEWHQDSFVAIKELDAQVSVLLALRPGNGAWTRLFRALRASGYRVGVVCPLGRFRDHLERCGWYPEQTNEADVYWWPRS